MTWAQTLWVASCLLAHQVIVKWGPVLEPIHVISWCWSPVTGVICAPEKLWCVQHMVPIHLYYPNYKYQHKAGNKANSLSFTDQLLQVISQFSFMMEIVEHWTGWGKVTPDLMFNFLINSQKGENKGKLGAVAVQHVPGWTFESKQCKIMESIRLEKTFELIMTEHYHVN